MLLVTEAQHECQECVWCDEEFLSHDRNRTENKVDVFVKGKIFVKGDVKKFNMSQVH